MDKLDEIMQTLEDKVKELQNFDCLKTGCLKLAIEHHECTYNADGQVIGPNADKVLEAAKKYYEWIKEK